jgi:hypothetical protein
MTFTYTKHTAKTWPVTEHEIVFECETVKATGINATKAVDIGCQNNHVLLD